MGLETDLQKRLRRTKVRDAILTSLELGGVLALAIMAPNVVQLLKRRYSRKEYVNVQNATSRLVKKGLISISFKNGRKQFELTPLGSSYIQKQTYRKQRSERWDGKWRIVIFDIPQARTVHRNLLRHHLREIGFEKLQNSVFVYPYDREELVVLLKTEFGLGKEVLYIIADSIERDTEIRRKFKL